METFQEIISSDKPVLVDFHATWCGPCKTLSPIIKNVKENLGDKIRVLKIDVDKNQKLADKLKIRGVPTLILYKSGTVIWRESGVQSESILLDRISLSL